MIGDRPETPRRLRGSIPWARTRPGPHPPDTVIDSKRTTNGYLRDPDVQLMLRVRDGDDAAFAQLVERYQDRVVGIFHHVLRDREAAEDLAQDVFLRVYRARDRYEPTAKFSTWLFRIANNLASNTRRSKGRRKEVQVVGSESGPLGVRPAESMAVDESGLRPSRLFATDELREVVRQALETLSERHRMALLLHKFEDMNYAEIGEAMDLSLPAVKSLLSRARESLRSKLEQFVR